MSTKIRKNIHIQILKYAQKHREFTSGQIMKDLNFNQNEKDLWVGELIYGKLLVYNTRKTEITKTGGETIWTISIEGRFRLLEYQQLRQAKIFGIIAIIFSLTVVIVTALIQLRHPISIQEQQFREFENIASEAKILNLKIDLIDKNQTEIINTIQTFIKNFPRE